MLPPLPIERNETPWHLANQAVLYGEVDTR